MNKAQRFFVCGSSWLLGLALIGPAAPNGFSKDQAKPASRPPVVPTVPEVPIPQSIFVVPTDS
ncbi:MAG TPA: hypothetical protein VKY92_12390, partial [Verrucomicrobiae bacterium]|nr:hypothetical protein [Verrucomicrobiae bacterium]